MTTTKQDKSGVLATVLPVRKRSEKSLDRYKGLYLSIPSFIAENLNIEAGDQLAIEIANVYRKPVVEVEE